MRMVLLFYGIWLGRERRLFGGRMGRGFWGSDFGVKRGLLRECFLFSFGVGCLSLCDGSLFIFIPDMVFVLTV
jgi:hypothetical protein